MSDSAPPVADPATTADVDPCEWYYVPGLTHPSMYDLSGREVPALLLLHKSGRVAVDVESTSTDSGVTIAHVCDMEKAHSWAPRWHLKGRDELSALLLSELREAQATGALPPRYVPFNVGYETTAPVRIPHFGPESEWRLQRPAPNALISETSSFGLYRDGDRASGVNFTNARVTMAWLKPAREVKGKDNPIGSERVNVAAATPREKFEPGPAYSVLPRFGVPADQ